ncbi:DUF2142 domain-containing protein [Mesorhizobium sp. M0496]|uniref:DUF2142 domain-containing protein n=1 Tax=Mesorhizobium sp. M0496 TaxID=2956952 RepID=UPI00333C14AE
MLNERSIFYAVLFFLAATIQCVFLVYFLPPFQGADEPNHAYRAAAMASGHLLSEMTPAKQPGGLSDPAIGEAAKPLTYLFFAPDKKVTPDALQAANSVQWSDKNSLVAYPNTAINSPVLYIPSAVGISVGRALHWNVIDSLELGRLINAMAFIILGVVAISLSGRAAPAFVVLLTLPMSASLGSYITQDGLIMATVALAGACLIRHSQRSLSDRHFIAAVLLLFIAGLSKLPYLTLILPLLAYPAIPRPRRVAMITVTAIVGLAWHIYVAVELPVIWPYNPALQISMLIKNPLRVVPIAIDTLSSFGNMYIHQAIGVLGWLDTPVPKWFVACACAVLILALCSAGVTNIKNAPSFSLFVLALCFAAIASAALIFGAMYVVWTKPSAMVVDGVQGRYFLPILAVLPVAVTLSSIRWDAWFLSIEERSMKVVLLAYVFFSVYVTISTTMGRYYT